MAWGQHSGDPAHLHHHRAVLRPGPDAQPARDRALQVSVDFPGSPTDHLLVAVYTTLDDTAEVWDLIPMMEFLIENTTTRTASASW